MAEQISPQDFLTLREAALDPYRRAQKQDVAPGSIKPPARKNEWTPYDCHPHSKWNFTVDGSGTTLRDGVTATPGFSIGNALLDARYYKTGRFVYVKIRGILGTASSWNNVQLQADGSTQYGDFGTVYFDLPLPAAANDFTFAQGAMHETNTILNASSVPTLRYAVETNLINLPGNNLGILATNQFVRNGATEVIANFFATANAGPLTYNASGPFQQFVTVGDKFDLQLKYETDVDS